MNHAQKAKNQGKKPHTEPYHGHGQEQGKKSLLSETKTKVGLPMKLQTNGKINRSSGTEDRKIKLTIYTRQ